MRLPVALSIVLHVAIVVVALKLPSPSKSRASRTIEMEVNRTRPAPEVKPITPPVQVAAVEPRRERPMVQPRALPERAAQPTKPERENEPEKQPEKQPETNPQPEPEHPSILSPRAPGKLDLTVRALPGAGGGDGVVLPSGSGSGGTLGGGPMDTAPHPKKEWHPRGDAGNPLFGKVEEKKEQDFPLTNLGREGYVYKGPQFGAHIALDGSVSFDDKYVRDFKGLSGSFDLTDIAMRGKKEDPYRHEKKKFMAATAELREKLAREARQQEIDNSLAGLPSHLEAIWAERSRSARERRRSLFMLWKEAAATEDERAKAGADAQAIIEKWIRARLPEGSEDAFTVEELDNYNRSSRVRFAPYR